MDGNLTNTLETTNDVDMCGEILNTFLNYIITKNVNLKSKNRANLGIASERPKLINKRLKYHVKVKNRCL